MTPTDQQSAGRAGRGDIRVGVGTSEAPVAVAAGRAAARQARAALGAEAPALVLVYGSVRYDLPELLAGVREITGAAPLAGASSSGHLHNGSVTAPAQGVAVLVMTAGPYRFGVGAVRGLASDSASAGAALARSARAAAGDQPTPHAALVLLSDGLVGNQQELLTGVHRVTGASVPVVGGAASDDRRLTQTSVFHHDQVLTDAAVAIWVGAPWPLPVAVGHGWRPVGPPMLSTRVDGPVVHELGGRDAVEVIQERFQRSGWGTGPGWLHDPLAYHPAYALGLIQPDGSQHVRAVYLGEDRKLRTLVPVPLYTPVQLVTGEPADLLSVVKPLVAQVRQPRVPSLLLAFSCVFRLEQLDHDPAAEASELHQAADETTTFGFYTYGEFARTTGVAGYHNAAFTVIAL